VGAAFGEVMGLLRALLLGVLASPAVSLVASPAVGLVASPAFGLIPSPASAHARARRFDLAQLNAVQVPTSVSAAEADAKRRKIDLEFVKIAVPAFFQFAAEPLARLVDTAYLGRLGVNALGGASAAIAAQYGVSKLYNDPLLRTTISIVAAQQNASPDERAGAVSTALLLALIVGVVQGAFFFVLAPKILTACLVGPGSPMHMHALGYLRVCSLGAPAATLWLATNGIFRGLGDTATPLAFALLFTSMNAALDPLFIFKFGMGTAGAAAGTSLAQTLALVPLLLALQRKLHVDRDEANRVTGITGGSAAVGTAAISASSAVSLSSLRDARLVGLFVPTGGWRSFLSSVYGYLGAGSFVLLRAIAKISAYSICAREAARLGAVASAAHNLCFQLGVATTQLCESIGIATQTLLARELGSGDNKAGRGGGVPEKVAEEAAEEADVEADEEATLASPAPAAAAAMAPMRTLAVRHILARSFGIGLAVAGSLSLVTHLNRAKVISGLTTIPEVRAAANNVMPLVLLCQTLKGLAYPVSGALMGALDWRASALAMWSAQASSLLVVAAWSQGGAVPLSLRKLWGALAMLFASQIGAGLVRIATATGPWKVLREPAPIETAESAGEAGL